MCACDEGRECARHRAESERHDDEEARELQLPACDRCTQGVMDATNSHYLGLCACACHR